MKYITPKQELSGKGRNILFLVLGIFFTFLLFVALIRNVNGGFTHITFSGLLEYLQNSPTLIPNFAISDFTIISDWGFLDGLRNFLNIFTQIFGLIVWFAKNAINGLLYVFYFVRFIFAI